MGRRLYSGVVRERFVSAVLAGGSVKGVAESLGVPRGTVRRWWDAAAMDVPLRMGARGGAVDPLPPPHERVGRYLSAEDRAVIAVGVSWGLSLAAIGARIGRDKSVVSRELRRNRGTDGVYRARAADRVARVRRRRPKPFKLRSNPALCRQIEGWMDQGWSPHLIAHLLAADAGADQTWRVSHETIYRALYVQSRGQLRADLAKSLSTRRIKRKPHGSVDRRGRALYEHAFTISERPPEVHDRAVPGHWEGDLIMGTGNREPVRDRDPRRTLDPVRNPVTPAQSS